MHTATLEAVGWWAQSRGAQAPTWLQTYRDSVGDHHRDVIVSIVKGLHGVSTVLEVGSNNGPNLIRLAQELPHLEQLSGVDVNAEAVADGIRWAQSTGLQDRIEFAVGRIPEKTDVLPDRCVDVVLSCYALAYIAPPDLDAVLYEMGRLAKRAMILAEPMEGSPRPVSFSTYQEWAHDYRGAAKWIGSWRDCEVSIVPVEPPKDRLRSVLVATRRAA